MARLQDLEVKSARRHWRDAEGLHYERVYDLPENLAPGDMPEEGDPMPGEEEALLGPFIEKGGISFRHQKGGAQQQVVLRCLLLKART